MVPATAKFGELVGRAFPRAVFSKINQCGIDQQLGAGEVELLGGIDIYKKVVHG